ncbi:hypothetical protein [Cypionkella psychrotolerans]|uniref:hypothetical protein n=1 Tax=Cypionkella psychrotolerans TaxID=1678131 RepID=UPI0006B5E9A2|nr:hypothetical protein [Cypionkella psychrotolerans]
MYAAVAIAVVASMAFAAREFSRTTPPAAARDDFEGRFKAFVSATAFARECGTVRAFQQEIDAVTARAALAFYPGILNSGKRAEFISQLNHKASLSEFKRSGGFLVTDCAKSYDAAVLSLWPVDSALDDAEKMNW